MCVFVGGWASVCARAHLCLQFFGTTFLYVLKDEVRIVKSPFAKSALSRHFAERPSYVWQDYFSYLPTAHLIVLWV